MLSDLGVDVATLDHVSLNKLLLEFNISPIPETDVILEYLSDLGYPNITAAEVDALLGDVDLEELQYDRDAIVGFLQELGVDTTSMDPETFDAILVELGISPIPEVEEIIAMLEHIGVTDVDPATVIALVEPATANADFVMTRDNVYSFLEDLGVDLATISVIALNEVMLELGVADPVLDTDLVLELLTQLGVTDVTADTIDAALNEAGVTDNTEITKPDVVEFLYAIDVDYESLDALVFQEVLA